MNSFFVLTGIESWKALLAALLLPPVPLLLMVLVGTIIVPRRRRFGSFIVVLGVALLWLGACTGVAQFLSRSVLRPPVALTPSRIQALKTEGQQKRATAIVVLGGGMEPYAPEYGVSNLHRASLERLRYGIWLGRATGLPVAFSGGTGHAQAQGRPEAEIAARIAAEEFGRPLRWTEERSRDTRENAAQSIALLRRSGIDHVVLVTHGWHMPRALRDFREAAAGNMRIEAAPMGLAQDNELPVLRWIPSSRGFADTRNVLHELVGLAAGA